MSIIVPICKPGKEPSLAESYRPVAMTSHVTKLMEKILNDRFIYYLETREEKNVTKVGSEKEEIL